MNEELNKRLMEALDGILAWSRAAGDFVVEQAPLVVQELLAWEFWSAVVVAAFMVPGIVAGALLSRSGFRVAREDAKLAFHAQRDPFYRLFPGGILLLVTSFVFGVNVYAAMKVTVAPRLVVIEKLQGLLK